MLFTLGIGSATSLTGGVITIICDQFPKWARWLVTLIVCTGGFLLGLMYVTEGGTYMLDLIDNYGSSMVIYWTVMVECSAICYGYGLTNLCNDIEFMCNRTTGIYWRFCWAIVIPFGLLANMIYFLATAETYKSGDVEYPAHATGNGENHAKTNKTVNLPCYTMYLCFCSVRMGTDRICVIFSAMLGHSYYPH